MNFIKYFKYVTMIFTFLIAYIILAYTLNLCFPINIYSLSDDPYDWILAESHSDELEFTTSAYKQSGEVLFRAGEYKTENARGNYFMSYIKHPFRIFHPQIRRGTIFLLDKDSPSTSQIVKGFWFNYYADYHEPYDQIVVRKALSPNVWVLLFAMGIFLLRLLYSKFERINKVKSHREKP